MNSVKLTSSARLPWKSHSTVDNVYGDDKRFSRGHELLFSLLIIQHNPFKSQRMAVFIHVMMNKAIHIIPNNTMCALEKLSVTVMYVQSARVYN